MPKPPDYVAASESYITLDVKINHLRHGDDKLKTLLALRGAGNRGKTKTLKILIAMIKAKYPQTVIVEEISYKCDVTIVITIDCKKVGIETQGDPNSRLKASLKKFVEINCKAIICACRSRGETVEIVNSVSAHGYNVQFIEKLGSAKESQQTAENQAVAKKLFTAFQAAIDA